MARRGEHHKSDGLCLELQKPSHRSSTRPAPLSESASPRPRGAGPSSASFHRLSSTTVAFLRSPWESTGQEGGTFAVGLAREEKRDKCATGVSVRFSNERGPEGEQLRNAPRREMCGGGRCVLSSPACCVMPTPCWVVRSTLVRSTQSAPRGPGSPQENARLAPSHDAHPQRAAERANIRLILCVTGGHRAGAKRIMVQVPRRSRDS